MGFLDSLKSLFSGQSPAGRDGYWIYVKCHRCGEGIKTRLDLQNSLNPRDEGGYAVRKTLVGNQLCFQRVEVELLFDEQRNLEGHEVVGGQLITADEFEQLQNAAAN